ncbi:MAG: biotin transporter BioY [Candidatus Lokiarchaeota archaeon]|nr:biotin transporter BioY [Candidatus Harpocratesius repetitus]
MTRSYNNQENQLSLTNLKIGTEYSQFLIGLNDLLSVLTFALLTGLGGLISITLPFTPVPITFQTFSILLSGFILGKNKGVLSQILYIFGGIAGIPWFSGMKSGISVLIGSTSGYLIGFVFSAWTIGWIKEKSNEHLSFLRILSIGFFATSIIYISGVSMLLILGLKLKIALNLGLFPFLPGDMFKLLLVTFIFRFTQSKVFYYSDSNKEVSNPYNNRKQLKKIFIFSSFPIGLLIIFIVYLYSNGSELPPYLIYTSLIITFSMICCLSVITLIFPMKKVHRFDNYHSLIE